MSQHAAEPWRSGCHQESGLRRVAATVQPGAELQWAVAAVLGRGRPVGWCDALLAAVQAAVSRKGLPCAKQGRWAQPAPFPTVT